MSGEKDREVEGRGVQEKGREGINAGHFFIPHSYECHNVGFCLNPKCMPCAKVNSCPSQ